MRIQKTAAAANVNGMGSKLSLISFAKEKVTQSIFQLCRIACASSIIMFAELPAHAEWTDRNRLAAETWRVVDRLYLDRTFNGQDWFKLRQEVVNHDYNTDEECYQSIQAMLAKLNDKYTRYLSPAQYASVLNIAVGQLVGVGIELAEELGGGVTVENVAEASPAHLAGIMKGDVITSVDSVDTSKASPEEVASLLRGNADTKVSVTIRRDNTIQSLTIVRKPISVKSVSASRLLPVATNRAKGARGVTNVGYIKIRSFASSTSSEVAQALRELQREADARPSTGGTGALVLDLRDNGGGLVQGAVETANIFLKPGKVVVFVVSGTGNISTRLTTADGGLIPADSIGEDTSDSSGGSGGDSGGDRGGDSGNSIADNVYDVPIYVLVNGNTASAAEVFAAALQENGRARLAGSRTYGKGIVQSLQELRQGGVAVTYARYETPLHHNIHKVGIPVDVELTCSDSKPGNKQDTGGYTAVESIEKCLSNLLQ